MPRDRSTIAVLLFDRAPLFEQSVPISVFGVDRTPSGAPEFTLLPVAAEPGGLTTTGGIRLDAPHGLDALDRAGVVIAPSWRDARELPPESPLRALRAAHADGALIVGLCMGAFVLAASGLLDGRRAATHWFHAPALAEMYPQVRVDPEVLYVDEGDVITSAGTAAGLDACLHVVRRLWGAAAATSIARRMVTPPQRTGGQAQYIDRPLPPRSDQDELAGVMAYALAHLDEALDVGGLAARAHLSRRTFDRRFRAATGVSPLQWLLHQRVLGARTLLERTELPVDRVAREVGLGSAVSLRQPFRRLVGVSPQQYRNTFRPADGWNPSTDSRQATHHRPARAHNLTMSTPSQPAPGPLTVQLIGGPTALIDVGGVRLLTDPTFDPPGDHPVGARNLVKTIGPALAPDALGRIDAVLLSHDHHPDNLDDHGRAFLAGVPLVLSTAAAQERLGGPTRELPLWRSVTLPRPGGGEVRITGVPARHGPIGSEYLTGEVRGFVVSGDGLPTVYVGGDNASLAVVEDIAHHAGPVDVAFLFGGHGRSPLMDAFLTFDSAQMARAAEILGAPTIIPVHVDGWRHLTEDPDTIPDAFAARGLTDRLLVLRPGEVTVIPARRGAAPTGG